MELFGWTRWTVVWVTGVIGSLVSRCYSRNAGVSMFDLTQMMDEVVACVPGSLDMN